MTIEQAALGLAELEILVLPSGIVFRLYFDRLAVVFVPAPRITRGPAYPAGRSKRCGGRRSLEGRHQLHDRGLADVQPEGDSEWGEEQVGPQQ
jgi:hypothetical protein